MKKLKFETKNQLEVFSLEYLLDTIDVEIDNLNNPIDWSVVDVAKILAKFLYVGGFAKIEYFECPEGCTGCDAPKELWDMTKPKQ